MGRHERLGTWGTAARRAMAWAGDCGVGGKEMRRDQMRGGGGGAGLAFSRRPACGGACRPWCLLSMVQALKVLSKCGWRRVCALEQKQRIGEPGQARRSV